MIIFKAGLVGKSGKDVTFLGQFDAYRNLFSSFIVNFGDHARAASRKTKVLLNRMMKGLSGPQMQRLEPSSPECGKADRTDPKDEGK